MSEWQTLTCYLNHNDKVLALYECNATYVGQLEYAVLVYQYPPCDEYDADPHWIDGRGNRFELDFVKFFVKVPDKPKPDNGPVIHIRNNGTIEVEV